MSFDFIGIGPVGAVITDELENHFKIKRQRY
jgi:hypothetical protein